VDNVTIDELKAVTKYGPFLYPDATLVAEKSFTQKFSEGTEIYNLEFGASVPEAKVEQWFKDHLESGVRITPGKLGDGSTYTGYEYASGDKSWRKTVTVKGFPSQQVCTITVNLISNGKPPEKEVKPSKPAGK
jgi:hypothetical protein